MTKVVLIRHGESRSTIARRIAGARTCDGLSPLGVRQAEALRDRLAGGDLVADVLVASHFLRARQTAEAIQPALRLPIDVVPGLGEHDPGPDCDGLTFREFADRYGHVDWASNPYVLGFPGGETVADFHHRVASALYRTLDEHNGKTVVIVCHGGVIDVALRTFLRTPMTGEFELHTWNCSLTELQRTERAQWRLLRYNDVAHLHGLPVETPT